MSKDIPILVFDAFITVVQRRILLTREASSLDHMAEIVGFQKEFVQKFVLSFLLPFLHTYSKYNVSPSSISLNVSSVSWFSALSPRGAGFIILFFLCTSVLTELHSSLLNLTLSPQQSSLRKKKRRNNSSRINYFRFQKEPRRLVSR